MKNETARGEPAQTEVATFGAGCFWCVEAVFLQLDGVVSVESGYSGGTAPEPTYEQICTGKTGHAEVCRISYDPAKTAYNIQMAFVNASADNYPIGPIQFDEAAAYPPDPTTAAYNLGPETIRTSLPFVTVTPHNGSLTEFDITFAGDHNKRFLLPSGAEIMFQPNSGKQDHPLLIVSEVLDDFGNSLTASPVATLKEPSPEFRVNDPEPDDPETWGPDLTDQISPAVAMDAEIGRAHV